MVMQSDHTGFGKNWQDRSLSLQPRDRPAMPNPRLASDGIRQHYGNRDCDGSVWTVAYLALLDAHSSTQTVRCRNEERVLKAATSRRSPNGITFFCRLKSVGRWSCHFPLMPLWTSRQTKMTWSLGPGFGICPDCVRSSHRTFKARHRNHVDAELDADDRSPR